MDKYKHQTKRYKISSVIFVNPSVIHAFFLQQRYLQFKLKSSRKVKSCKIEL